MPVAAESDHLVVVTVIAAQPQGAVGRDAAREEGVELVLYELRQVGSCRRLRLGDEGRGVLLYQSGTAWSIPGDSVSERSADAVVRGIFFRWSMLSTLERSLSPWRSFSTARANVRFRSTPVAR